MKNLFYTMVTANLFFFNQVSNAQITLLHTFNNERVYASFSLVNPIIDFYSYLDYGNNQIKLYNDDFSLYKTITITPPETYLFSDTYIYSRGISTAEDKVSFLVRFYNDQEAFNKVIFQIIDENGTIVKDFGGAGYFGNFQIHVVSNQYRLSFERYDRQTNQTSTEVYSLPGTVMGVKGTTYSEAQLMPPYPNPAHNVITLPYNLKQGETSVMHIFNMNGQLIETKQIDSTFDKILLNVSSYTKGIYFYEVNGVSRKFVVN